MINETLFFFSKFKEIDLFFRQIQEKFNSLFGQTKISICDYLKNFQHYYFNIEKSINI